MALFLKYRPQTFTDLVGQDSIRKTLQNALKAENPSHAYLFAGSRGTGKTSTARIFAKGLNCTNLQDGNPCGECSFCVQTAEGSLVDVIEIDAASNRGIDEIRELRDKILFSPNIAKRKVYIIDEVHMLTKEAFNALLKTLEEPPDHAFFCLATTEMHKIPETITSRCQTFLFQRFGQDQMVERLQHIAEKENFTFEEKALQIIARKAEGGLRDGISLLEQVAAETENQITFDLTRTSLGISDTETLVKFYEKILEGDTESALEIITTLTKKGQDLRTFGHDFLAFLREKMHQSLKNEDLSFIMQTIEAIQKALTQIKTAPIMELPLEIAIIKLTKDLTPSVPKVTPPLPAKKEVIKTPAPVPPQESAKQEPDFLFETAQPQPKVKEEKKVQSPVEPQSDSGLTAAQITRSLETILQKADLPVWAKKSLLTTTPQVEGGQVIFYTDSEFHREKLASIEITQKIQQALHEVCATKAPISFVKKSGIKSPTSIPKTNTTTDSKASVDDFLSF